MPRIQYYVAASLDGFIATSADDLGWLLQFDGFEGGTESYEAFMAGVPGLSDLKLRVRRTPASAASSWAAKPMPG